MMDTVELLVLEGVVTRLDARATVTQAAGSGRTHDQQDRPILVTFGLKSGDEVSLPWTGSPPRLGSRWQLSVQPCVRWDHS